MVTSLFSIISGSSCRFPATPMQIHKQCSASADNKTVELPGQKILIYEPPTQTPTHPNPLIIHSYMISHPPASTLSLLCNCSPHYQSLFRTLSTHSSCSSGMDDMLGTESGVYMSPDELKMPEMQRVNGRYDNWDGKKKQRRGRALAEEYPPAIPLLARTGNLPGHMPWILTRHCSNGRLVLKEEKVKHHEYFEAYRENGRLILNLVPLDETVTCCHPVCEKDDNDQELELETIGFFRGEELDMVVEKYDQEIEADNDEGEDNYQGYSNTISSAFSVPKFYHGNERYGDPRKCLTYSGWMISESSSMFPNGASGEQQVSSPAASSTFYNIVPTMTTTDAACLVN